MSNIRTNETVWTRKKAAKSALLFTLHFFLLVGMVFLLMLWDTSWRLYDSIKENGNNYLYMLFCIFLLVLITYFYYFFESRDTLMSGRSIALVFAVLDVGIFLSFLMGKYVHIYARPVALVSLLILILVGRREAVFMNVISAILMFVIDNFSAPDASATNVYSSFIIAFSAGMIAIFFGNRAKTRFQIVGIGLIIVIPVDIMVCLLEISGLTASANPAQPRGFEYILSQMGFGLLGGVSSAVFFLALLPVFEAVFNCLTAFRLRELTSSSDSKLLKKLQEEAPGTFSHSMSVAQLAEACAAALGEDVDAARAAAYYHDVGKLHQPEYFTENQSEYNLHDELTPELSADIIRSHAQDGYDLIRANHLPQFLADVALEHHGTMPIRYFYAKALKMTGGELNIEDFSYLGPRPKSKLAAIIMIADASEAAVRALSKRTPEEVEKVIRGIIEERMDLEQFSDCNITMAELTTIRRTLVNTLTGVYHHRVKYPSIRYKRTSDGRTTGEND